MPTTTFAGRRPQYIEQYARAVSAANRFADIQRTIADERAAVQYTDGLIAQERQVLAGLQDVFRTPPADFAAAQTLLKQEYSLEDARRQADAARRAGAAAGARVDSSVVQGIIEPLRRGDKPSAIATARNALRGATPRQAEIIIGRLEAVASTYNLAAADLNELRTFASQNTRQGRTGGTGDALRGEEEAFAEALEAAYFAGPSGIRGGYDGLEVANLRGLTSAALRERATTTEDEAQVARLEARAAALEATEFGTAEDALQAALAVVRATGDPSAIEDEYARTIYEEARANQAYRNDQRADFEQEVLDSRRRLATLEEQRAAAPGSQYDNPRAEAARRELTARGYDVNRNGGKYLRYQKTDLYDVLIDADKKLSSVLEADVALEPANRPQRIAETLVRQYERTGREYDISTLRGQLSKALSGDELQDALGYALAFKEYSDRNLEEPSQRELQRRNQADAARREKEQAERAAEARAASERARQDVDATTLRARMEQRDPATARTARSLYTRARAAGLSPETARAVALDQLAREPAERPGPTPRGLVEPLLFSEEAPAPLPDVTLAPSVEPAPPAPPARDVDPTNASYSYEADDAGGYRVFLNGRPVAPARAGTRAAQSIERVLSGAAPLPRAPAAPPTPDVYDRIGETPESLRASQIASARQLEARLAADDDALRGLSDEELERRIEAARR